jgi:circadian clock protein KaiB
MNDAPTKLRLYIAGNAPNSVLARRNLDALLASLAPQTYQLEIIDCLQDPARTLADGIFVTPTLLKIAPPPECTVVGSLSDPENLRSIIGLGKA